MKKRITFKRLLVGIFVYSSIYSINQSYKDYRYENEDKKTPPQTIIQELRIQDENKKPNEIPKPNPRVEVQNEDSLERQYNRDAPDKMPNETLDPDHEFYEGLYTY